MPEETGEMTDEKRIREAAAEFDLQLEAGVMNPQFEFPEEPPSEEPQPEIEADRETLKVEPETEEDNADDSSLTKGESPEPEKQEGESKWAKNESRKKASWVRINAEKDELKRQRDLLEQQARMLEAEKLKAQEGKEYKDDKGYTASDYVDAAERLRDDGKDVLAKKAEERADEVRGLEEQAKIDVEKRNSMNAWEAKRGELMDKVPELKKNDSELTKMSNEILRNFPILTYNPQGLEYAVEVAKLKLSADSGDKAKSEVKELSKKLEQYEKKMSVTGGFTPDKPEGDRAFDDMSADEQEGFLRKAAAMADDVM